VLHRALERAIRLEIIGRNVASAVPPPKVTAVEIAILTADQIAHVLTKLNGHPLRPLVALAIGSGMRRGEICGLPWGAVDLERVTVRVERSLEETKEGLRFKEPKTRHGHRTVSLPPMVVDVLRAHRRQQGQQRLSLGLGRAGDKDLVFARPDGSPYPPDTLSRDWWRAVTALGLPRIMFHALRHSHDSALIAAGLDVVAVSRRLGHGSAAITLSVYAHAFNKTDAAAARAIEDAMGAGAKPSP
jgi:integrase